MWIYRGWCQKTNQNKQTNKPTSVHWKGPDPTTSLEGMIPNSQTAVPKFHFRLTGLWIMGPPPWAQPVGPEARQPLASGGDDVTDSGHEQQSPEASSSSPARLQPGTLSSDRDASHNEWKCFRNTLDHELMSLKTHKQTTSLVACGGCWRTRTIYSENCQRKGKTFPRKRTSG